MSKSRRRSIADIEDDCGYDYGTPEFREYVLEYHIDIDENARKKHASIDRKHAHKDSYLDD